MPLNILLADDSMTAQNMAKKILSEAGYEVTTVSNGAAALKKIAERTPDLVILDIYMPGYTGLEVCERVKRAAITSRMPVLLSVGKLEPYREQDATAVRADGVIVKPFEATELVTIVTNVILRASGDTIDAATRPPTPSVAVQASPAIEPEPLPVSGPLGYTAELANPESQAQDIGPAITYSPATVSNGDYLGTSLPPVEEKPLTMAVPAAASAPTPEPAANFAAPGFRAAEADSSSMPFMIDQLLRADETEKAAAEDSFHRFSGPVLDVSPVAQGTEEIETIEIPAPEPSVGTVPFSYEAVPAEPTANSTGGPAVELTAFEVEEFLREHATGAGPELVSPTEIKFDNDAHYHESAWANAVWQDGSAIGFNKPVADANAAQAPPMENQAVPVDLLPVEVPPVSHTEPEQAAPEITESDNQPVFEVEPVTTSASTSAVESEPVLPEPAAQLDVEKAPVEPEITVGAEANPVFEAVETPAAMAEVSVEQEPEPIVPKANIGESEAVQPDTHVRPTLVVHEPAAQLDVEKALVEPEITVGAEANSVFEAAETPAAMAEVSAEQEPEPIVPKANIGESEAVQPDTHVRPTLVVHEPAAQLDVEMALVEPEITVGAEAKSVFEAAETPAAAAEVSVEQEPEPEPVTPSFPVTASETQTAINEKPEDFMFSVPMVLEATAAMSLLDSPDPGPQPASEPAAPSTFGASTYAVAAARPAALDEAAIAGAVQRVMERFKPQIVAEIVRELAKHKQ